MQQRFERALVAVSAGQAAAVRGRLVGGQLDLRGLTVFEEEDHIAAVIAGKHHAHDALALVHAELGGQVIAQLARLAVGKVARARLVDLRLIGEEHQLGGVGALHAHAERVVLLELLLAGHAQRLRRDLFKVPVLRQKQRHGIVLDGVLLALGVLGIVVEDAGAAGLGVLFAHVLKFADDDLADA